MKKTTVLYISVLALIMLAANKPGKSSSGAPASHTGAPNEKTCATIGCHDDNTINNGNAILNIDFAGGKVKCIPGETYAIKINIKDAHKTRFGFQIVAMESKSNNNIGEFIIVDSLRTQTVKNLKLNMDRNYVTYTFNGTDAIRNGESEWIVNWKAPSEINESVTFYVAAVSANDDMTDKGDIVYTKSLTIKN